MTFSIRQSKKCKNCVEVILKKQRSAVLALCPPDTALCRRSFGRRKNRTRPSTYIPFFKSNLRIKMKKKVFANATSKFTHLVHHQTKNREE